jgi:hypothetical protein
MQRNKGIHDDSVHCVCRVCVCARAPRACDSLIHNIYMYIYIYADETVLEVQ